MRRIALLLALLLATPPALAQEGEPPAGAWAVQSFIEEAREPCRTMPAQTCVDLGWAFAASDPQRGLTVGDVASLRGMLGEWFAWKQGDLPAREKGSIGMGLMLADGLGMPRVHAAFDADGDGLVSQQELLADVRMDSRPLGEVLADPQAVDRAGLARRLGLPLALLEGLFQQQ